MHSESRKEHELREDLVQMHLAKRTAHPSACRLVSALFRLPSLLPEPPATHAGLRLAGRRAALPWLNRAA
jgi:hypothetical protein